MPPWLLWVFMLLQLFPFSNGSAMCERVAACDAHSSGERAAQRQGVFIRMTLWGSGESLLSAQPLV